jgi:hypothetical protein
MLKCFGGQASRVSAALAQEEARHLKHNHIGMKQR